MRRGDGLGDPQICLGVPCKHGNPWGWVWMVVGQVVCMGSCRPGYTGLLRGCWAGEERVPSAGLGRVQVDMGGGR